MPRQFDQFLQNAQLTNNPNNTISAGALANLIQPPPNLAQLLEQILIDAINKLLTQIDDVTGLDLLAFAEELEGLFGPGGLLTKLLAFIQTISGSGLIQALIDAIANALGLSGINHLVSEIKTLLENIPFANILSALGLANIGEDVQAIIDHIIQALGGSGTGHILSDLITFLEAIPNGNILAILGGANLGADVQAIVDKIINALGTSGTGHTLATLLSALESIPNINITNILGGANLGADVQAIVDKLSNAFGHTGTGHTLANLLTYLDNTFGSSFPKVFPFVFGSSTSNTPAPLVALSQFQQLVDGIVNNGSVGNQVAAAVAALQSELQTARSDIAQAILDGIHSANSNTGIAQALQNLPFGNITSILGNLNLGADVQAIIDHIVNALGVGGTGHPLADLLTYLEQIPNTNITAILGSANLGADLQAIVDNLANAFGQAGTGHTLANLLAYAEAIPNINITNILGSANLGADVQAIVDKLANAFGQAGTNHTLANLLAYAQAIPNANIAAILGSANLGADVQAIVDKLANAFGQAWTNHTLANLLAYAEAIPNVNITAILGGANLGADVQAIVDKIVNALGTIGTGHTLATLLSLLGAIPMGNVSGLLSGSLGSSFPKTFPFQFGTATSNTLAGLVSGSQFQQLLDGIVGDGGFGHTVSDAVAALQRQIDAVASGIVQAILDGINSVTNQNSGIASALGAIPGANIASITNVEQNVVDFIDQAVNGGEAVGNAVSTVLSNIESHNVALPVVFDAVGAGNSAASLGSGTPLTWAHTIGTYGNEILLVAATFAVTGGFATHVRTCTWTQAGGGAQNLTSLGAINSGGSTGSTAGWVELFYVLNPNTNLSNSGTVSVSVNVALGNVIGESVSYGNVAGVTGITTGSSNTNATSFTGANATTPDTSYAVAAICASQSITSVVSGSLGTITQRAITNFGTASLASNLAFADIPGVPLGLGSLGFTSFTGHSGSSASWGGVQAVLSPSHTHQTAYQAVVDAVVSNLTPGGGSIAGSDADLIGDVLSAIPALNVAGVGGPVTIAGTHQATWDAAVQAIMGVTTTGHSIADFFNALLHLKTTANAAYSSSGALNNVQIFNASGTYTVPVGMGNGNHFDIIVIGGGGGGAGGQYPDFGNGGAAGSWNAVTLTYGTSFTTGTTSFTVTVGAGGTAGAASGGTGGSGGATSVAIAGYGSSPVTTSGGAGGSGVAFSGTGYQGASPGPETFNGTTYSGGAVQNTKSAAGNSPGGGGSGGYSVLGQAGGAGSPGAVIIVAYT